MLANLDYILSPGSPLPSSPVGLLPASSRALSFTLACPWPGQLCWRTRWGWSSTKPQNLDTNGSSGTPAWLRPSPTFIRCRKVISCHVKVKCSAQEAGVYFCRCRRGNWRPWHMGPRAPSHGNCPLVCKDSLERWRRAGESPVGSVEPRIGPAGPPARRELGWDLSRSTTGQWTERDLGPGVPLSRARDHVAKCIYGAPAVCSHCEKPGPRP